MARVKLNSILQPVQDTAGNAITGASVAINVRGGGAATVYSENTGGATLSSPLTTTRGRVPGWVDEGSYDAVITWNGQSDTEQFEAIGGAPIVAASAALKARLTVNVKDYGALGDGTTNDTAAVQAAYAALPASGGTLYFPPGTYMLGNSSSIGIFTKPLQLVGDGRGVSILKNRDTNAQHFMWMKGDGSGARNVTIDGRRSIQSSSAGSAVQFSGTGSGVLVPVKDISIVDCEVLGGGFDAIGLTAVSGGTIRGNIVRNVFDTGIDLVEGTKNVSILDNTVYCDGRFGIALDTADAVSYGPVTGCTIAGNTVVMKPSADTRYGILLQTASDCSVTGNTVDCSAAGLQGIRFDNEFVRGTCKANIVIGGTAVTRGICVEGLTQQLKMVTVTDNAVRDVTTASQSGIGVDNAIGVTIGGNQIENCKRGINAEGSAAKPGSAIHVHRNILRNCDTGVRFGGSTGTSVGTIGPNTMLGTFSFRYAVDSVWTVHTGGEWDTTGSTGTLTSP